MSSNALRNKVLKDYKDGLKGANTLFLYSTSKIAKILYETRERVFQIVAGQVGALGEKTTYMHAIQTGTDRRLTYHILQAYEEAALKIEPIWQSSRRQMALYGRLLGGFIARKNSPPWVPVKIDLHSPMDGIDDPWRGQLHYQLKYLGGMVIRQVELGLVNKESLHKILNRLKKVLGTDASYTFKEGTAKKLPIRAGDEDQSIFDTEIIFDIPAVQISTGVFTENDVQRLQDEQVEAMEWQSRRRDVTNRDMWELNGELRMLESRMMSDNISALHNGLLKIGTQNMGVTDYQWVTSKPQKKCDGCSDRDGMTMSDIKGKFTDDPEHLAPPLHPNCRCQLVPILRDDWAKDTLKSNGIEWDDETGTTFFPNSEERSLGFTAMTWDQWINKVSGF